MISEALLMPGSNGIGLSTLALGSFIAMAGIVAGATLALRWQRWRKTTSSEE